LKKKRRFENVGIRGLKRIDVIISEKTDKENPTSKQIDGQNRLRLTRTVSPVDLTALIAKEKRVYH
jgi:hypothetical protein